MKKLWGICLAAWVGASCQPKDDHIVSQRTSIENYLNGANLPYVVQSGVYRYTANADRDGYEGETIVEPGDSVTLDFAPYSLGRPLGTLYYTNVREIMEANNRDGVLDPRFWDFSPKSVRVGHGGLLPSVEAGMVGCRQNDSTFLFVTSDLSYGSDRVGLIEPDSPVVWYLKINKVVKNR